MDDDPIDAMRNIDPNSEENRRMTKDNERAVFAAKMKSKLAEESFDRSVAIERITELETALAYKNDTANVFMNQVKNLQSTMAKKDSALDACVEALKSQSDVLDTIWEEDEMGWLSDPESESGTEECVKCGGVLPHGGHSEDCLQGKIHKSTIAAKNALALAAKAKEGK